MEQIVERKNKSTFRIFLVIIGFVVLIDFITFIMNRFTERLPYITTLTMIFLTIISCSYILIKYFSKYSYILEGSQLTFNRVIGKRRFEMLRMDISDLIYIGLYDEKHKDEKYSYNFTFDKKGKGVYIGRLKGNNKTISFLFSPNENILRKLK